MTSLKSFKWTTWLLLGLSLAAFVFLLWLTPAGDVLITRDSGSYISAARSLLEGEGFLRYNRVVYARWPPLYPLVLVVMEVVTAPLAIDLLDAIRILNALTYAALVFVAGQFFLRLIPSPLLALLATFTLLFNWPLILVSVHAWSEPLFNVLVVVFLLALVRFVDHPSSLNLLWLTVVASLATLQRYSGIVTIATGALLILRFVPGQQKWRYVFGFCLASITPLLLWNIYNQIVAGNAVGEWDIGGQTVTRAIEQTLRILGSWLLPGTENVQMLAGGILVAGIFIALVVQVRRQNPLLLAVLILVACFTILTAALAVVTRVALDNRMYSPIFVLVTGLIFVLLENVLERLPRIAHHPARFAAVSVIFTLTLLLPRSENLLREFTILRESCCYDAVWAESSFISWLREQPDKAFAWNNAPEKSRIYSGYYGNALPRGVEGLAEWRQSQTGDQYIIWYDFSKDYTYRYSRDELIEVLSLEPVMEIDGSGLYRLRASDEFSP